MEYASKPKSTYDPPEAECLSLCSAIQLLEHRKHKAPIRTTAAPRRLGWAAEQVIVIDTDLGQSAAVAKDREGFQRLAAEVGWAGRRSCWVLKSRVCTGTQPIGTAYSRSVPSPTPILDEDGTHADPAHFNDRLRLKKDDERGRIARAAGANARRVSWNKANAENWLSLCP